MVWRTRHFPLLVSLTLAGCTAIAGLGEFDDVAGADGGEAASGGRGATASSGQGGGGGALACDCRPAAEAPFQGRSERRAWSNGQQRPG
ncbi:MAG: hypothetical protein KC731_43125, partial [Myxococcales bacterium]|nr:hypothetical protein [Myxococcales bacterium]